MSEQSNMENEILTRLTRIETKIDAYKPQIDDHEARLRELESKSGKRWDNFAAAVISAIVVGVIGYVIGKLL